MTHEEVWNIAQDFEVSIQPSVLRTVLQNIISEKCEVHRKILIILLKNIRADDYDYSNILVASRTKGVQASSYMEYKSIDNEMNIKSYEQIARRKADF